MPSTSVLENLAAADLEITPWNCLDSDWQKRIEKAITSADSPTYLATPHTPESLCRLLTEAYNQAWPILTCGSGSKLSWGGLMPDSVPLVLSTHKLNRLLDHAVGDLTVTAEAGMKLADLQAHLAQHNQYIPLHPAHPESTTLGGLVATGDTWRERYGGLRDMILGISFVRSDGKLAKAGGRVVKNVAGYDMMKLFSGSYGTLGVISQVTLRTYPIPEASATLVITGNADEIAQIAQTVMSSGLTPSFADILSAGISQKLKIGENLAFILQFCSISESVDTQIKQVESLAKSLNLKTQQYRDNDERELCDRLRSLMHIPTSGQAITCKIGVTPTTAVDFLQSLQPSHWGVIHMSNGVGRLHLQPDIRTHQIRQLRETCENYRGFLTILESPVSFKQQVDPWGYPGNAIAFMRKIKQQFDPKNILNPGRFIDGI
ncbi:MAG: FAD-binding oxidoreductase [Jaaginema sp. PMC 1079.18]|nr:FAD-binding oxidoreductase [Jaaginema sp. PMC 1080.18]MEC4850817.1 FAD-binding oxidoreductase [Jaaginema sp. PMC 1079.18]MEC4867859.1 FAD-binding oxidoreductase [Jaaginema sp. PMC 1078.18]